MFKDRCAYSFNAALLCSRKILEIALNPVMENWWHSNYVINDIAIKLVKTKVIIGTAEKMTIVY